LKEKWTSAAPPPGASAGEEQVETEWRYRLVEELVENRVEKRVDSTPDARGGRIGIRRLYRSGSANLIEAAHANAYEYEYADMNTRPAPAQTQTQTQTRMRHCTPRHVHNLNLNYLNVKISWR